jgi:major membrane immunogen (membrane-anchored lipoprotein)
MVEFGGAQSEWHEQAAIAEAVVLENQDGTEPDAITGVSIHIDGYFALVEKTLGEGVKDRGQFRDGTYHAEEGNFSENTGWKNTVDLTVVNGNIVAANWNGVHKDGGDDKKTASISGDYGMVANGGASSEWHEQAAKAEAFLLEKQDPKAVTFDDEGYTDAITGVTIHVNALSELAEQALTDAK